MKVTKMKLILAVLSTSVILSGCSSTYEQRPVPWAKAKFYQAVEMTGVIDRGTYIRKPSYYSPCSVPQQFQTCHNYYLGEMRCTTPVKTVSTCGAVPSCGYRY